MSKFYLILLLNLYIIYINSIQFYLKSSETKCLSEDVPRSELVVGEFNSSPNNNNELSVKVSDVSQNVLFSKLLCNDGKFAFTASKSGEHTICFINNGIGQKTISFTLKTGVNAKDYSAVAKKDNLKPIEVELRRLEDQVQAIHDDMKYLKNREESMRNTNESTNSRVLWFSIFSMVVLVVLGGLQLYYLKNFFKSKKIL